jgi:chemotaxis protein MotB
MSQEEDSQPGIPEWVVTFGDMMSLLLTFFIMLVSLSEIKEEEKYQALVDAVKRQFGYDSTRASLVPGRLRPRNSALERLATLGRARKLDVMKGGDKIPAPVGDFPRVRIVRPGTKTTIGTVIFFAEDATELNAANQAILDELAPLLQGKPQKIEIRGHTSLRPVASQTGASDHWELAFLRCNQTMQYLVGELQIDAQRVRLSVAAANEPLHIGTEQKELRKNPRVEVFLLDELVNDLVGTPAEKRERFSDAASQP